MNGRRYRKRPVIVTAVVFPDDPEARELVTMGDERALNALMGAADAGDGFVPTCPRCFEPLTRHGVIGTLEGRHVVCPGDYIIEGVEGELYPCKPSVFRATYEEID